MFITDFWRQVVLEHSKVFNLVLNNKRLFVMKAESNVGSQGGCFVEHVQVADCELLRHSFTHLDCGALFSIAAFLPELDAA